MQEEAAAEDLPALAAAPAVAPDVAEAAAAAAFELPVHAIQPLPVAPAAAPAERQERASGEGADDDGFEFGSDAASDSSSSWKSSDEETGAPISSAALPAWLARRTAGGRCACGGGGSPLPPLTASRRCAATWTTTTTRRPLACRLLLSQRCASARAGRNANLCAPTERLFPGTRARSAAG